MKAGTNNNFPPHFRDFIHQLNELAVEYLLIGGYAMGAHGHIRATTDLDIFINATNENAEKMIIACINYGIPKDSIQKDMFLIPRMIGIGEPPLRIEILKQLDIVNFEYAYQRAIKKTIDNIVVNIVSVDDLLLLKKSAIRDRSKSRDIDDLNFLEKLVASIAKRKKHK